MIDWKQAQERLRVVADGDPGPRTYLALIAVVGQPCQPVADCLARYAEDYGMVTPPRLGENVAQIANETGGFTRWEENLNYSAQGLANTWPGRYAVDAHAVNKIPNPRALAIAHNPEAIGNDTYGLRMGNLDAAHDTDGHPDGWEYRGRGALQLTGRAAYEQFGRVLGLDLVTHPEKAAEPYTSTLIALEFFKERHVNAAVDRGDFTEARRLTNGGSIGLDHVAALRAKLLTILD